MPPRCTTPFEAVTTPFEAVTTPFEAATTPFEDRLSPLPESHDTSKSVMASTATRTCPIKRECISLTFFIVSMITPLLLVRNANTHTIDAAIADSLAESYTMDEQFVS
ncbi:hypothetical protein MASR2M48_34850 [Spirochaetota bacterium]